MKKNLLIMCVVFGIFLISAPSSASATTTEVQDCKASWACFKRAAQTCTPAKVRKSPPSIELFGVKQKAFVTIEMKGENTNGQCAFTFTPYKFRYIPTPEHIELVMKQSGISALAVRREIKELEKMVNTKEMYETGTFHCSGDTQDVATFFRYFVREYKNMEATTSITDPNRPSSTMSFANKQVQCSNT